MSEAELTRAREALSHADWRLARDCFERALRDGETAEALEGLGMAAWWLNDAAVVFEARERAFHLYRRLGSPAGAGRVAIALAQDHLYFRGELAVANGWFARAHRLIDPLDPCPEQGWLKVAEADCSLSFEHDPATARALAIEAASIARSFELFDLEMMALAVEGITLVCEGRLKEGMARLDEATTAAVSGELQDFYAMGFAYCCMVLACERIRDYERAIQWCKRAKDYGHRIRFDLLVSFCNTQYASVLISRGEWEEAERELLAAGEKLRNIRPPLEGEALVRLAQLRRLQGRRAEAEAGLASCGEHPLAPLESAMLALEAGDAAAGERLAERFLRQAHEMDFVERARGLETLLHARISLQRLEDARKTLTELQALADALGTRPVRASALVGAGLLAASAGALEEGRSALEDAIDLFHQCGAPLDEARARLELGRILLELERPDAAQAEAQAAAAVFTSLGATDDAQRADAILARVQNLPPAVDDRRGSKDGLTAREVDVLRLVAQGLSNAQIAEELCVSQFTVKRHVANILAKLGLPTRAAAAAYMARTRRV